jgi:hypothetical protein
MAKIEFKAKVQQVWNADDTPAYRIVTVPVFKNAHCDMCAFRFHPKFGHLANSAMFPNVLARIRRDVLRGKDCLRLDKLPENVKVDESGFLARVTVDV